MGGYEKTPCFIAATTLRNYPTVEAGRQSGRRGQSPHFGACLSYEAGLDHVSKAIF
jgi:hypothetical protein